MSGAQTDNEKRPAFKRYQDIASLSHRFCMPEYQEWATKMIHQMICSDSSNTWMDLKPLFGTLSYAKIVADTSGDNHLERNVRNLIYDIIYDCVENPLGNAADIATMLEIYQAPPPGFDLSVYGFIFTCVLSFGFNSAEWNRLTQVDRYVLYAAQAHLAPLQASRFPFEPLTKASRITKSLTCDGQPQVCFSISRILETSWDKRGESWDEELPLVVAQMLRTLPNRRKDFAQATKNMKCFCSEQCSQRILAKVDENLNALFTELAGFPKWISE